MRIYVIKTLAHTHTRARTHSLPKKTHSLNFLLVNKFVLGRLVCIHTAFYFCSCALHGLSLSHTHTNTPFFLFSVLPAIINIGYIENIGFSMRSTHTHKHRKHTPVQYDLLLSEYSFIFSASHVMFLFENNYPDLDDFL